jgi:hypothetical protein
MKCLSRIARWVAACAVPLVILGPELLESHVASAAAPAASTPIPAPILALVSPIAAPECQAAGSATLLVPIVGGLVADKLGIKNISIGNLLLEALGPVYVVCGDLPSTPNTQCSLDDSIEAVWPASIAAELPPPNVVGALVNEVAAALKTLGLPPQDALANALKCHIVTSGVTPTAPVAPPSLPPASIPTPVGLPSTSTVMPLSSSGLGGPPLTSALSPTTTTTVPKTAPAEAKSAGPQELLTYFEPKVPAIVAAIQLLLAALLFVFLVGSWVGSLRSRRLAESVDL